MTFLEKNVIFSLIMEIKQLQLLLNEHQQPSFRMKQILDWYYGGNAQSWNEATMLPASLREVLTQDVPFTTSSFEDAVESDDVIKFVFKLTDGGEMVEAVIMKHDDGRRTLCLSSQAGCPMGCYFCATGTLKLKKNLTASEMLDIVRYIAVELSNRDEEITNIVYMGMGEPFSNYEAVKESIQLIHDYFEIGWRKISVSTCGIVPMIKRFAKDFPQVNLAISIHAATDEKRSQMMPINDNFDIATLMKACEDYVKETNRKIFFEYLVIDGFNDKPEDAVALKKILNNKLYHLNLIRFHATEAVSSTYGIPFTLRRSFGEPVDAACGMLALKNRK